MILPAVALTTLLALTCSASAAKDGGDNADSDLTVTRLDTRTGQRGGDSVEVEIVPVASLAAEKATLHQMLLSYEKDFFEQHKRQVSSAADIRPVVAQYRRYKEIKKAIVQKSSS